MMREFMLIAAIVALAIPLGVVIRIAIPRRAPDLNKPISKMNRYEVAMAQIKADAELDEARQRLADAQRLKASKERALARKRAEEQDRMIREMYTKTTGKLPPK